jgi:hypothetical protein
LTAIWPIYYSVVAELPMAKRRVGVDEIFGEVRSDGREAPRRIRIQRLQFPRPPSTAGFKLFGSAPTAGIDATFDALNNAGTVSC